MSNKMSHTNVKRGYTLLELIVSLGIFSMVMLVVLGAYVTLISLDRQARANGQLASSLSFGLESMARAIRTGGEYACNQNASSPNCVGGGTSISFCPEGITCRDGDADSQYRVTYILKNDGSIGQCTGLSCTQDTAVPLTDPRITISTLRFYVRGVDQDSNPLTNDTVQPSVTIVVAGTMVTDAGESSSFSIQTGATQRAIEL
jgi:prepilin-type N-terminal cleavage/methylation domain-containing protein